MGKFPLGPRLPQNVRISRLPVQSRTGPTINRGKGNNNAATPWKFIGAVEEKFGPLTVDLAASDTNHKAKLWITEAENSLVQGWNAPSWRIFAEGQQPLLYLNPPFTNITPWARKCAEEVQLGARILLLVPGSIGANWLWDWVMPYADVYSVGRMVFDDCWDKDGKLITTVYPKDLILCHYEWRRKDLRTGNEWANPSNANGIVYRWRWQDGQTTAGR